MKQKLLDSHIQQGKYLLICCLHHRRGSCHALNWYAKAGRPLYLGVQVRQLRRCTRTLVSLVSLPSWRSKQSDGLGEEMARVAAFTAFLSQMSFD